METDYSMDMSTIIEISFYCYYDSLVHHPFRVFQILLTHQGHPKHGIQDISIDIFSKQLDLDAAQHNETSFSLTLTNFPGAPDSPLTPSSPTSPCGTHTMINTCQHHRCCTNYTSKAIILYILGEN